MQKYNVFGNTVTREIIFEPKIGESAFYGSFLLSGRMSPRRHFVAVVLFVLTRRRALSYSTGQISIYYFAVILILTSLVEMHYFICAARVGLPGLQKSTSKCQVRCTCQPNFSVDRNFLLYFLNLQEG
jgi:hypothetical protein